MHYVDQGARKNQKSRGQLSIYKFQAGHRKTFVQSLNLCLLRQAFLFDLFSASRPSGFAETLSFLLELLSFFPLSFEGMFENFKNSIFLL